MLVVGNTHRAGEASFTGRGEIYGDCKIVPGYCKCDFVGKRSKTPENQGSMPSTTRERLECVALKYARQEFGTTSWLFLAMGIS